MIKEGHFVAGGKKPRYFGTSRREKFTQMFRHCKQSLIMSSWLGLLTERGFRVQSEVLYEKFQQRIFKSADMVNHNLCCPYVNNQVNCMNQT